MTSRREPYNENSNMSSEPAAPSPPKRNLFEQFGLRSKSVLILAVPVAAMLAAVVLISPVESDVTAADQMVRRFYDTRSSLVRLSSSLGDAETAAHGYLAVPQIYFAAVFERAHGEVTQSLNELDGLVGDSPEVVKIGREALDEMALLGQLRDSTDLQRAVLEARQKALMGEVQGDIGLFRDESERKFTSARYVRDIERQRLFRMVMACGVFGTFGTLLLHLLMAGRMVRRLRAVEENARRLAVGLPLDPLPPGNDEICALSSQVERAAYLLREREREVLQSEARYRNLFDRAPIAFEETDLQGVVRRFNQAMCALLKCTPDQMQGRHAWDSVAPGEQEAFRNAMLGRIESGAEAAPFTCDYFLQDGSGVTVEVRESLVRNSHGEVTGMVRSLLDATDRNLAEVAARKVAQYAMELRNKNEQLGRALEAARSATAAKSRFLASVSHELRTPLNGVIGFSELLYDGRLGPLAEEQRDVLGDILSSARHLLQLINDVLDLSKIEAGKMEFHPEPSSIRDLVGEVCDVMRPLAERKHISLSVEASPGLNAVIDPGKFKQVLYNYLSNAVKFTALGGQVKVRVTPQDDACFRLEVEDNGIGIEASEFPRLFQEFQQLPGGRHAEQGTGLGLALTRRIVEAQGGSVSVRSQPGVGSVFSAVLPLVTVLSPANALNGYGL